MTGQASQTRSLGVCVGFRKHSISHLSRELGVCYTLPEEKTDPMPHGHFRVSNSFVHGIVWRLFVESEFCVRLEV